jgi:hypothetical protein
MYDLGLVCVFSGVDGKSILVEHAYIKDRVVAASGDGSAGSV